jgi:adenosylcobinamide kinase/adenosylcobinamide-phosphate guanylyltransferase
VAPLTLVTGGVRSGKSRFAEQLAARHDPVTYLATAQAGDVEMAQRIARHRERRPASWGTVEEPWNIGAVLTTQNCGCVLVECLSLWLTNLLTGVGDRAALDDEDIRGEVRTLVESIRRTSAHVIVVSNEVGCGIMPVNALARRFGDLLGEANQRLAEAATEVFWCVAGVPVRIKSPGSEN